MITPQALKAKDRHLFNLLSSSLPLEYSLAKELVRKRFSTSADYQCERDEDVDLDWSVDLYASTFPFQSTTSLNAELDLLVECKYRRPGTVWLFFPDPNRADFSPFRFGGTLHCIDQFSPYEVGVGDNLEDHYPLCYKGVEIRPEGIEPSGKRKVVDDVELKHGQLQLQWAIPKLIDEHVRSALHSLNFGNCDDLLGLFFASLLVTTADIRVAKRDFDSAKLLTTGLDAQSLAVPAVITRIDRTHALVQHWVRRFDGITGLNAEKVAILTKYRADILKEHDFDSPTRLLRDFAVGNSATYLGSQVLICTEDAFASIVDELVASVKVQMRLRRRLNKRQMDALSADLQ